MMAFFNKAPMKLFFALALCLSAASSFARNLTYADDDDTHALYCYITKSVRVNGELRATELYTGGPNRITDSGYLSVIDCKVGYLELRDKRGVTFTRGQPEKLHIVRYRDYVCDEKSAKLDKNLK